MTKRTKITVACAVVGLTLAGCTVKTVDIQKTGAELVHGTNNLYRFCDGETLIYFSKTDAKDDEYEWFYPGGCTASPPKNVPNGDSTEDRDGN